MTDQEFARAFETGAIAARDFHHVDHVRLAWTYLVQAGSTEEATARMRAALRRFAEAAGQEGKYSDRLTAAWMREVAAACAETSAPDFETLIRACPRLLDAKLCVA